MDGEAGPVLDNTVAMVTYGSGPDLSEDLDIAIDETGDVRVVEGEDELSKDLGFRLIRTFESQSFGILDPATREDIRVEARTAITDDPRVDSIQDISVIDLDNMDRIAVGITVIAGDQQFQAVQEIQ